MAYEQVVSLGMTLQYIKLLCNTYFSFMEKAGWVMTGRLKYAAQCKSMMLLAGVMCSHKSSSNLQWEGNITAY